MTNTKLTGCINLSENIYTTSKLFPDKLAIVYPEKITYKEFWKDIVKLSLFFFNQGISKGVKTVVLVGPTDNLFATVFALLRIGAIPVLIDPGMGVKNMINSLNSINPDAFIGTRKAMFLKYLGYIKLSSINIWLSSSNIKRALTKSNKTYNLPLKIKHNPNDNAAIFFTSGSTGPAKAVLYTNRMLYTQVKILKEQFHYTSDDIDLCTFPLVSLLLLTQGISIAIADMDMLKPAKLDASKLYSNIVNNSCTSMFCSPMVLGRLSQYCNSQDKKLPSLNKLLSAGAPVTPVLLSEFRRVISEDCKLSTPYGATEVLPVTNISDHEILSEYDAELSNINGISVGKPLAGIDLRIITICDDIIPDASSITYCNKNEVGEIIVSGDNVTSQYYNNELATQLSKILIGDKLFHRMGDLGRIDGNGKLWLYGRKTQRVISKNKVYFTIPTESVFNKHPKVKRSALVGIYNKESGFKIPVICIELEIEFKETDHKNLFHELNQLGKVYDETLDISKYIVVDEFPVDPRHNAKIYREKLTSLAQKKLEQ